MTRYSPLYEAIVHEYGLVCYEQDLKEVRTVPGAGGQNSARAAVEDHAKRVIAMIDDYRARDPAEAKENADSLTTIKGRLTNLWTPVTIPPNPAPSSNEEDYLGVEKYVVSNKGTNLKDYGGGEKHVIGLEEMPGSLYRTIGKRNWKKNKLEEE